MRIGLRSALIISAGLIAAVFASLSIHVVMLQNLHVPYPSHLQGQWLARLPDGILRVGGTVAFYRLIPPALKESAAKSFFTLWLVTLLVNEDAIRLPLMNIINLSNLTAYPFLDATPLYLAFGAVAAAVIASRRWLSSTAGAAIVTVAIGVLVYALLLPAIQHAFAPIQAWTAAREGRTLYNPPYDWHIEVPAYITFAEPVCGAFLVAALTYKRLPSRSLPLWRALSLMIFALRGQFFTIFTNIPLAQTDPVTAMLSYGQFSLESAALAVIVAAAWVMAVGSDGRTHPALSMSGTIPRP